MKTIWIVSAGAEAVPGIVRAKELGYSVVASDNNPNAPGFQFADEGVVVSTYDVAATAAAARQYHRARKPIDGIIAIASDVPLTVATVAHQVGTPGITLETARLASDKLAMKECLQAAGIPIPWFAPVHSAGELQELARRAFSPLVLKPVDSRGARGVLRLTPGLDLQWAYEHALSFSPSSRVMVEEFLEGPQISTESVLIGEHAATPGFCDRNYEKVEQFAPYMPEDGGHQPSTLSALERQQVAAVAEAAARALGIRNWTAKGDIVLTSEGPKVIEVAARLSGGWFATDQIPSATGVDLVGIALRLAVGDPVSIEEAQPRFQKGVAIRYFFPQPGQVESIRVPEALAKSEWVQRMGFFVSPGDRVGPVSDHSKRAGFVITTGEDCAEAVSRACQVVKSVQIQTSV